MVLVVLSTVWGVLASPMHEEGTGEPRCLGLPRNHRGSVKYAILLVFVPILAILFGEVGIIAGSPAIPFAFVGVAGLIAETVKYFGIH
jgi:hypothetical protein